VGFGGPDVRTEEQAAIQSVVSILRKNGDEKIL
jgi:hypothetical protein